jgi:CubicO group peptidase (beta-lactamase class C family)
MKVGRLILCFGLALISGVVTRPGDLDSNTEITRRISDYMDRIGPFGFSGSLLVAQGDHILFCKGFGMADRFHSTPYDRSTIFDIGSLTKQFTAAAVLKLEMQGRVGTSDVISKYFDRVPPDKATITLHQLLTHTSGLQDTFGGDYEVMTRAQLIDRALHSKLLTVPGERFSYSNAGYSLLAAVIEIASGDSYEEFLRENLFEPAAMNQTGYAISLQDRRLLAHGYEGSLDWGTALDHRWATDGPYWNLKGNGGILSTLDDLFRWSRALRNSGVLSDEAKRAFFTPYVNGGAPIGAKYAYGWTVLTSPAGTTLFVHTGSNSIFFAELRYYVQEDIVIISSSNCSGLFSSYPVRSAVVKILFGQDYSRPPRVHGISSDIASPYSGIYRLPSGGEFRVASRDGALDITPSGQDAYAWIAGGQPADTSVLNQTNHRVADIVEMSRAGNFLPLQNALSDRQSSRQTEAEVRSFWSEQQRRFGTFVGFDVFGSERQDAETRTLVRLRFERAAYYLEYVWDGKWLRTARPTNRSGSWPFQADDDGAFVYFDLEADRAIAIRIFKAENGEYRLRFDNTGIEAVRER